VADLRTTITEVVTGLGMLGFDSVDAALAARPDAFTNIEPSVYDDLQRAWKERRDTHAFTAALMNGLAFLHAEDALRHRVPALVEWKGAHRAPGDEVVPADLRVDHVYLVSCKYLSRIVVNASPHHLFDRLLAGGQGRRGSDWFREVAPAEYAQLYSAVRPIVDPSLPSEIADLDVAQRRSLANALRGGWPDDAHEQYRILASTVATASADRWNDAVRDAKEAMLWRLLRIGSAPYFVLGASNDGFLRLRIGTPWDWRQAFELRSFEVEARAGGQPMVGWCAVVRDRAHARERVVEGHVEVRWSHGRFAAPPEAKVYLDTRHDEIPGYFPLK
jgi:hypothetical protein